MSRNCFTVLPAAFKVFLSTFQICRNVEAFFKVFQMMSQLRSAKISSLQI